MANYITAQGKVPTTPKYVATYLVNAYGVKRLIVDDTTPFHEQKIASIVLPAGATWGTIDLELGRLGFTAGPWKSGTRQMRSALTKI